VIAASRALFGQGDLREIDIRTLADACTEVPHTEIFLRAESAGPGDGRGNVGGEGGDSDSGDSGPPGMPTVADLMALTGIVPSKSAARRAIAEGGASLNNRKVTSEDAVPERSDLLHDRYLIVRRGKRTVGAVDVRLV
jgi:tyrosyl-tRNA synthetase